MGPAVGKALHILHIYEALFIKSVVKGFLFAHV